MGVRVFPLLVSLAKLPTFPVARLVRFAPNPINGDPDCGEPSALSSGEFDCTDAESQLQDAFHEENDPVNDPFQIKQLFPFWQDGP